MEVVLLVLGLAAGLAVGYALGYFLYKSRVESRLAESRNDARSIMEDANRAVETSRREAELAA